MKNVFATASVARSNLSLADNSHYYTIPSSGRLLTCTAPSRVQVSLRSQRHCKSKVVQLVCLFFQIDAEIRVGNIDQLLGALADGFAIQIGDAIFRYHVANMIAACDHTRAEFQHGGNTSD